MSLSVCCQWLEPRTKRNGQVVYENSIKERLLQLGAFKKGKYTEKYISSVYHNNIEQLTSVVPKLIKHNIKSFRVSSNLFPLFDFCGDIAKKDPFLIKKLANFGHQCKTNNIRITTHPGQFTVLSSDSENVIQNSIKELEYHAWIFDQMGFACTPSYAINVHGGKKDRATRLISVINSLPNNVKSRLTLENDESSYNVRQLLTVHEKTDVPVVWDSHHHEFNSAGLSKLEASSLTKQTWRSCKPLQHISNTEKELLESRSFRDRRKHSYYIHSIPQCQLEDIIDDKIDLDVEAKGKNLAVLKLRKDFSISL